MKKKGMSKKELKAPDEFQAAMIELWQKYGKYWKHFVIVLVIIIAVPVIISLYSYFKNKKESDAYNTYSKILVTFIQKKDPQVLENFINNFKGTKASIFAEIREANFYFNQKNYNKALNIYNNLVKNNINDEFKNFAKLCKAQCYIEMGKINESKTILSSLKNDSVVGAESTLYLAFISEKNKNIAQAKQLYQEIIDRYKGFLYLKFAEAKVNEL